MDTFSGILEFISKHGFAALAVASFIFMGVMLFLRQNKIMKQQMDFSDKLFKEVFKEKEDRHAEFKKEVLKSVGINARIIPKKNGFSVYIKP